MVLMLGSAPLVRGFVSPGLVATAIRGGGREGSKVLDVSMSTKVYFDVDIGDESAGRVTMVSEWMCACMLIMLLRWVYVRYPG